MPELLLRFHTSPFNPHIKEVPIFNFGCVEILRTKCLDHVVNPVSGFSSEIVAAVKFLKYLSREELS